MFFFFNDTATTEIYTLSLHDALPISLFPPHSPPRCRAQSAWDCGEFFMRVGMARMDLTRRLNAHRVLSLTVSFFALVGDRKSTRLNSSHANISYAVFCLKKTKITEHI